MFLHITDLVDFEIIWHDDRFVLAEFFEAICKLKILPFVQHDVRSFLVTSFFALYLISRISSR